MRMLSKFILTGAVATIAAALAPAQAEEAKQRFTHEGYTYVYEVKDTKTGQQISGLQPSGSQGQGVWRVGRPAGCLQG